MNEQSGLTPTQRALQFRRLAESAERRAAEEAGPLRDSFLYLADQWRLLADETERTGLAPLSE